MSQLISALRPMLRWTIVFCFFGSVTASAGERPNIVIVLADDLNADSIGCYGNRDVRTPNMDALAEQGMRFSNAYTSTAMCAPTRAQLYTGLFPVRNGAYPNHSGILPDVRTLPDYFEELGYRVGLNGKRHFGPASAFPFEAVGGNKFDAKAIEEFVSRDDSQSFCLVVASHSPHLPWKAGDSSQYDPDMLTVPEYLVDTPETRAALSRYYAEVTDVDRELGECLRIVDNADLTDNTIFIFTSEQGAQLPGGKWTCYENGLRVGLIIRWPNQIAASALSHAWVHYVDVIPTLLGAAGAEVPAGLDGRSFLSVLRGANDQHRDVIFGVHTQKGAIGSPKRGYPIRSIRIGSYKYIWNLNHQVAFNCALTQQDNESYWKSWLTKAETDEHARQLTERYLHRPPEEFYDLSHDPLELMNLASLPQHRVQKSKMRKQLEDWMVSQGDLGLTTEMQFKQAQKRRR